MVKPIGSASLLAGSGTILMMLVYHDDAQREYAYGPAGGLPHTSVASLPNSLIAQAKNKAGPSSA